MVKREDSRVALPCRCGHMLHFHGVGPCLDCRCGEYQPDEHEYPLGQGWVTS